MPGARVHWTIHLHAVGEEIRDHVELAVYLYPKGEVPQYRTRLMHFSAIPGNTMDIPPNSVAETSSVTVLRQAADLRTSSRICTFEGRRC